MAFTRDDEAMFILRRKCRGVIGRMFFTMMEDSVKMYFRGSRLSHVFVEADDGKMYRVTCHSCIDDVYIEVFVD
jgi:hypothetical protein